MYFNILTVCLDINAKYFSIFTINLTVLTKYVDVSATYLEV